MIHSKIDQEILYVELDNLNHGNSFGPDEAEGLWQILKDNESVKLKGLLFYSKSDQFFCAGGNLSFYAGLDSANKGKQVNDRIGEVLTTLHNWPHPTVCLVNGDCLGGGMELISAFDKVYSAPHSFFGFWQRRIGLSFGWGGGQRWLERISARSLKTLCLEARSLSAYEAQRLGLIDEIGPRDDLIDRGKRWLSSQYGWPLEPVAGLKLFQASHERKLFNDLWLNPSHQEVLTKYK